MRILAGLCGLAMLAAARVAMGDPFTAASLPEATRWVIHLDVDAGKGTPLWNLARVRLLEPRAQEMAPKLALLENITGMTLPDGLHDVTLYGATYDEASVCIRIHGEVDAQRTMGFLRLDADYKEEVYQGQPLVRWRDKERDRLMYVAFTQGGAVISASAAAVKASLDTLAGKAPGIKAGSSLSPDKPAGAGAGGAGGAGGAATAPGRQPTLWVAAEGIPELLRIQKADSPVLAQMDAATVSMRWDALGSRAQAQVQVQAKTEDAAQQMKTIMEGVKAMLALAASDEHAAPRVRIISSAVQELALAADGRWARADWALGIDKIDSLIELAKQERERVATPPIAAPLTVPRGPAPLK